MDASKPSDMRKCEGCDFVGTPRQLAGHKRYCLPYKLWKAKQPPKTVNRRGGSRPVHAHAMTRCHVYLEPHTLANVHNLLPASPGRGMLTRLLRDAISAETIRAYESAQNVEKAGSFHTTILIETTLVELAKSLHPAVTRVQIVSQLVRAFYS